MTQNIQLALHCHLTFERYQWRRGAVYRLCSKLTSAGVGGLSIDVLEWIRTPIGQSAERNCLCGIDDAAPRRRCDALRSSVWAGEQLASHLQTDEVSVA
jgi:hypothetical protein